MFVIFLAFLLVLILLGFGMGKCFETFGVDLWGEVCGLYEGSKMAGSLFLFLRILELFA